MKVEDLQIGTLVLDEAGTMSIVVAIDSERSFWHETLQKTFKATARLIMVENFEWKTSYGCWVEKLSPINITDELLLKFGFSKNVIGEWEDETNFTLDTLPEFYGYLSAYNGVVIGECKYIHQLQEIYKATTGKTINLKNILK